MHTMTSSNGNFFRVTGHCGGIHRSSPHKGQWRGGLMFSLICAWINGWLNNREAGDLRRHRAPYDVIVMLSGWRAHNDRSAVEFVLWIIWRLRIAAVQTWFNFRHKPYYYVRNVVCIREKELPRKVFWGLRELLSNTAQNGNQHAGSTVQCRYNTVQYIIPIHHDITNYAVQRATENSPAIGLTKYIPYLALTGGLWCALFKESVEKWPYYNGFAL